MEPLVSGMSGEVQHFEIPYDKADWEKKFYGGVFGWKMSEVPPLSTAA